ncbi:MAG: (Fe-S)-binding protein [Desulfobacteraceae bacterium]|nr:MAG: (Fe-S)-binding protein [Desulfobacteraceae bacterium]
MTPERELFWKIGAGWLFYVLAALAMALLVVGVAVHVKVWLKSAPKAKVAFSREALKQTISDVFLGLRVLKGEVPAGIMHAFIFWGFVVLTIGTTILLVHEHLSSFLAGTSHLLFEITMEIGGLILLAGILWALVRRYLQRVSRLERRLEDALVPLWLLVVVCSGFVLEGVRLASQKPAWADWSFVGAWTAGFVSPGIAESTYPYLWWGHALLSLGFIAVIPYTKLFHVLGAPAAYYLHHSSEAPAETSASLQEPLEAPPTADEGSLNADDASLEFLDVPLKLGDVAFYDACMRCGRCVQACPSAGAGEAFAPRDFIQATVHELWQKHSPVGDIRFLTKDHPLGPNVPWHCTTCAACLEVCPVYGATFESVLKKRALLIQEGTGVPDLMNQTLERLFNYENPWVSSKREKAVWTKGLDIPTLAKGGSNVDLCYFVGCTTSIDARAQAIAKSFSSILKQAGVRYGILGDKEPCCGDIARVAGEIGLFEEKKMNCVDLFGQYDIKEVVTSSPHCFHAFLNEYPLEKGFGVRHYSLLLRELIGDGRLNFKKNGNFRVTYHDPCYLGRHNRIFDEPREVLRSIPGTQLIEMSHHGPDSLCCGAGGGRMWQGKELDGEARMSEIRVKEAHATGAEILITACPLCLIMLEDALKTLGLEKELKIMDLNELVQQSLDQAGSPVTRQ